MFSESNSHSLGGLLTLSAGDQTLMMMNYNLLDLPTSVVSDFSTFFYTNDALNRATGAFCRLTVPGFATVEYAWHYELDAVGNVTNRELRGISGFFKEEC